MRLLVPTWVTMSRCLLVGIGLCIALGFGLNFATSNQSVYLLGSVRMLDPSLWQTDWWVGTRHYHPAYTLLGALLLRLDETGWALALGNVAAVGAGLYCVHRLLCLLVAGTAAVPAFMVVAILASATHTQGVGGSYVFSDVLQPSTLGSVGLLAAAAAFAAGRPLLSGLGLAFAGVFHVNYLVLALGVFGFATLLLGRENLWGRALKTLGPPLLVLLYFLPFLLESGGSSPEVVAEARRVYQDIRVPHHYRLERFAVELVPWIGFQVLGAASLWVPARKGPTVERRLLCLLVGFWALVLPAALFSSAILIRQVDQLFAWRVCPHAELLAQAALAASLARAFLLPAQARRDLTPVVLAAGALGLACLLVGALLTGRTTPTVLVVGFGAVALLAQHPLLVRDQNQQHQPARRELGLTLGLLATFALISLNTLLGVKRSSSLLDAKDRGLGELCSWLRTSTALNTILLTPPEEGDLRFQCRRAIVVDWRATPALPHEVLEWKDRIERVTGRHPLQSQADLAGYRELTRERLESLRERYHFDVVVVKRDNKLSLGSAPDFSGERFLAYRLPPSKWTVKGSLHVGQEFPHSLGP